MATIAELLAVEEKQREKFKKLLLDEYTYWRDAGGDDAPDDRDMDLICMGAMASVSNVLAALMLGPREVDKRI